MTEQPTDIIIVSYNDKEELSRCIDSIKKYCINYNLIIKDNNVINDGYTKAVNVSIKKGSAPYCWLLNSDAVVLEGAQQALIDGFSFDKKVGICGSMQRDPDDTDIIRHGGTLNCLPGVHAGGRISEGACKFPSKQKWVNGASMMISRKMISEIGMLDERYFLICSDSDYCYYCRSKGYTVWYTPRSQILHRLKVSKNGSEWHQKDTLAFMKKWGITYDQASNTFYYSEKFRNLDLFP